jgi:NAD(P)-dependent dehydrogenase (short-subunit alcohol dehydrogenase family)
LYEDYWFDSYTLIAGPLSSILEFDLNKFDNTMAVNVRGSAATIKHAARAMVERKIRGSIICTASVAGSVAGCAGHDYTSSKHGLIGLVRSTCSELGVYGIRVNSISPYAVATPLACRGLDMDVSEVEAIGNDYANLKGITLKTTHIAETALFLASDESTYISGHCNDPILLIVYLYVIIIFIYLCVFINLC